MNMENKRDFKGVWIPKELYLYPDLSWTKKLLLIEIYYLDNGDGCWARDTHFAEHLMISPKTVSNNISELVVDGWIQLDNKNSRYRKIHILRHDIMGSPSRNQEGSFLKKGLSSIQKKPTKDNEPAKPVSAYSKLMTYFHDGHLGIRKEKPLITGKDGKALKELIKNRTPDEIRIKGDALMNDLLAGKEFYHDSPFTPHTLLTHWNRIIVAKKDEYITDFT